VLEAGLGGRGDATTAMSADLVCFTPVGCDHMDVLGASLREIAADKAAAMRQGIPAVTVRQSPEAADVLREASRRIGSRLMQAEEICVLPEEWTFGLRGGHQRVYAGLALAAWRETASRHGWPACEDLEREGLQNARIAGRLQSIPARGALPHLLLDGAHNTPAFVALGAALRELGLRPRAVIFSCLADKDLDGMVPLALDMAQGAPVFIPPLAAGKRSAVPERTAAAFGAAARVMPDLEAAIQAADTGDTSPQSPVLICGSLYLLAEFFRLYPEYL